jgi:DNA-3-methyladenine glycosylase
LSRGKLGRSFYTRPTLTVARDLLGRRLVRRLASGQRLSGYITEVEAYKGSEDEASHASRGRTERNAPMFGPPGHAYIYLIYGIHHCLNVVTEPKGHPAAVLIRALEPLEGIEVMRERRDGRPVAQLTSGPGRLCQALGVDRSLNGIDLCAPDVPLFLEQGVPVPDQAIATGPRVGVVGDELARTRPWRFWIRDVDLVMRV